MNESISLYKSHEKFYRKNFMYPMNSLSSLFYLIPIYYIDDYLAKFILLGLSYSSIFWWAKQTKIYHYFDLLFLCSILIWSLSNMTKNYIINYTLVPLLLIQNNNFKNIIILICFCLILVTSKDIVPKTFLIFGLTSKLSDTYMGNKYGTAIFHILTSFALTFI
jgi:hypothetical protein